MCVRIIILMILILNNIIRKCILTLCTVAIKPNFMSFFLLIALFLLLNMHILESLSRFNVFILKKPKRFAFHMFGLK